MWLDSLSIAGAARGTCVSLIASVFAAGQAQVDRPDGRKSPLSHSEQMREVVSSRDEVVVVAKSGKERQRVVREAVKNLTPLSTSGAVPRWSRQDQICLTVAGGSAPFDDLLLRTLTDEAARVHLSVRSGTCLQTVTVIITPEADALVADIAHDVRLGQRTVEPEALASFRATTLPVRWLRATEDRDAEGLRAGEMTVAGAPVRTFRMRHPTRLLTAYQTNFTSITIIVDTRSVGKVRNGALAAYLSMVTLSGVPQPTRSVAGIDTVLNLFETPHGATPGAALTRWDRAYLDALYKGPGSQTGDTFRQSMIASLTKNSRLYTDE